MSFILALDQGTTSSRSILFDRDGTLLAVDRREFRQMFPRPGWVEHDAEEIWTSQLATARGVLRKAGVDASDVDAIGITNQRETTVLWERETGRPVAPAIVWQDRRTAAECEALKRDGYTPLIRERTGLVLDAYFSATKLAYLLNHVEGARRRAENGELCFGTIDSWLIYRLTGGAVHATDVSNASRTMLLNIDTCTWDDELLQLFDVPRSVLPEVRSSSGSFGRVAPGVLDAEIPITGVAGDQQAALFGQACTRPGMAKNTYGTGCFLLLNTGGKRVASDNNLLTTLAWRLGDSDPEYALEGSVFIGGAVVQWLRDGLGIIDESPEVEALAASVADTDGVVVVPAFTGLGAPHWDPDARGTIVGLTRGSTAAHIARAALESIAYQSLDLIRAMEDDSGISLDELRVDGGASENNLLMQFQSDILQSPTVRPIVSETTALGAAYLAGLAAGVWDSTDEIAGLWKADRRFEPQMTHARATSLISRWHRALERSKGWHT